MVAEAPPLSAASTGYSSEGFTESLTDESPSTESWLAWCNQFDEAASRPLFELSLPRFVETVFTVPACFFGLTPSVVLGPIVLGVVGADTTTGIQSDGKIDVLKSIIVTFSSVFLLAWTLFLRGNRSVLPSFLGKKVLYALAVPWSVGVLSWGVDSGDGESDAHNQTFSLAIYSLWLWSWAVLAVLILKKWSMRPRPCLKYSRAFIQETKFFSAIPIMLSNTQGDESFPSGDATTAAAIAIPLALIDSTTQLKLLGWSITSTMFAAYMVVFLACSGRVYFLAHHVMDVVVGALIPYLMHLVSTFIGLGVYNMQWWHPLVANIFVAAYAKWNMKRLLNMEPKKVKV